MKRILTLFVLGIALVACDASGVKKKQPDSKPEMDKTNRTHQEKDENDLDAKHDVVDDLELDGGLKIKWFEHGEGEKLQYGEMVGIDYKVRLTNNEIIDGNHLLNLDQMQFMIGFGMQTPGWDIAMKELRVGDFVEIFIPSALARGDKAVEGLFPANSDNILKVRVIERIKPTRQVDGNKVWLIKENKSNALKFGENEDITFHTMGFTPSKPMFVNTFRDAPITISLEDYGVVPGLKKALINAKKADRMYVFVPSSEAYGNKGYQDLVKPGEDLLYNVMILNVTEK